MHELLSDPDLVHEAHTLVAKLVSRIKQTPDDLAPHGIAAEIQTDLGSLLLADPESPGDPATSDVISRASRLTVKQGPPMHWPVRPLCRNAASKGG